MKKSLLFALTLLFATQMMLADGAADVKRDTFGKCDEQYYSVIKLKIKRPEAVPFTINAQGGKVEFSTGNLQYKGSTRTFRFATRQWEFVGNGVDDSTTHVLWDSLAVTYDAANDKYDIEHNWVKSNNKFISSAYPGWIDLFGWGTSGFDRRKVDNKDPYNLYFYPYCFSNASLPAGTAQTANFFGYGPSVNISGVGKNIDTTDAITRYYDWGQFNDIYCVWVGYDTTKAEGNSGHDTILFDSTLFNKRVWRTLTSAEWTYLLSTRKIENKKSEPWALCGIKKATPDDFDWFGGGSDPLALTTMDTVRGLFIFPDDFEINEAVKLGFKDEDKANIVYGEAGYGTKAISYKSFMALEKLGVVFLPAGGMRANKNLLYSSAGIRYWSATTSDNVGALAVSNGTSPIGTDVSQYKCYGLSVRLVRDLNTKLEKPVSAYF